MYVELIIKKKDNAFMHLVLTSSSEMALIISRILCFDQVNLKMFVFLSVAILFCGIVSKIDSECT